jgi:hypothetical protein
MNSQESTGPRTSAAKAASRYNAVKHGIVATNQIMFDESDEDLAELAAEYHEHHSPADPDQRFLVDTLVANEWRIRRMRRIEAELWEHATNAFLAENSEAPSCSSGEAFATASGQFERLQRMVNSCERVYHRALKELQAQVARGHALRSSQSEAEAEPAPRPEAGPTPDATPQPQHSTPSCANLVSVRHTPDPPTAVTPSAAPNVAPNAAPKTAPAAPFAGPKTPTNPGEARPSAGDRDPGPPEAA